jgi:outer membrane protein TolC
MTITLAARAFWNRTGTAAVCTAALGLLLLAVLSGCSNQYHRKRADRESYRLIGEAQKRVHGQTNAFTIDTSYSGRELKDIPPDEIVADRALSGKLKLSLEDALRVATTNSRQYQFRKETLYLTALTLSREQYEFSLRPIARTTAAFDREANGSRTASVRSRMAVDQFLKAGGRLGAAVANDIFRFYTGQPTREITTLLSVNLAQPLLRGAGASIVAENLTQAERNVTYEVRSFSRFQTTFAVDITIAYLRLLQQREVVRNEYDSYRYAIASREMSEALGFDGRVSRVQVDQARQRELDLRNRYLLAVERYRDLLDSFKETLSLPLGVNLQLDEKILEELRQAGMYDVRLSPEEGYALAVRQRLDLLNAIDRFEDSKRKVAVAANRLKTDLNIFADASIESEGPTDYTQFNWERYRAGVGVQLDLPVDRLRERNTYRTTLVSFERELRNLGQELDNLRDEVRQALRGLQLARAVYEVQERSVQLADQRVEGAQLAFQAGRAQIRDLLEAQDAQLRARNSFIAALVDYHASRLQLLQDLGVLDVAQERFWLVDYRASLQAPIQPAAPAAGPEQIAGSVPVITPEELFENE